MENVMLGGHIKINAQSVLPLLPGILLMVIVGLSCQLESRAQVFRAYPVQDSCEMYFTPHGIGFPLTDDSVDLSVKRIYMGCDSICKTYTKNEIIIYLSNVSIDTLKLLRRLSQALKTYNTLQAHYTSLESILLPNDIYKTQLVDLLGCVMGAYERRVRPETKYDRLFFKMSIGGIYRIYISDIQRRVDSNRIFGSTYDPAMNSVKYCANAIVTDRISGKLPNDMCDASYPEGSFGCFRLFWECSFDNRGPIPDDALFPNTSDTSIRRLYSGKEYVVFVGLHYWRVAGGVKWHLYPVYYGSNERPCMIFEIHGNIVTDVSNYFDWGTAIDYELFKSNIKNMIYQLSEGGQ
jgi:hypothetical protein